MVKNIKLYYADALSDKASLFLNKNIKPENRAFEMEYIDAITRAKMLLDKVIVPRSYIERTTFKSFEEYLRKIVDDFSTPLLDYYFSYAQNNSSIYQAFGKLPSPNINYDYRYNDVFATIKVDDFSTNKGFAILAHEFGHYYQAYCDNRGFDVLSTPLHSEIIPIYFEYLMYKVTSPNGFKEFINNRSKATFDPVSGVKSLFNLSLKEILELKNKYSDFRNYINDFIKYLYSYNAALGIIERRLQDKRAVDLAIEQHLSGRIDSNRLMSNLDIKIEDLSTIEKVLVKKQNNT